MNGSPAICCGEPGAAGAQHAALAVQQHLGGDVDRLGERALDVLEPGLAAAVGHRLVLQRALAALVADRAVQRVVDQQQLHHALLRLVGDRGGELGPDHHAVGDGGGAGRQRLALALDLDQALPAGAHRVEQRVVAEPRDLDADQLGGADHQRALGHPDLDAVDGQVDQSSRSRRLGAWRRSVTVIGSFAPAPCAVDGRTASRRPGRTGSRRARGARRTRRGRT